jgi:hypothetical protein
MNVF